MSGYRILIHPNGNDTYLDDDEHSTVDGAVKAAITMGSEFAIVQMVDWKATEADV